MLSGSSFLLFDIKNEFFVNSFFLIIFLHFAFLNLLLNRISLSSSGQKFRLCGVQFLWDRNKIIHIKSSMINNAGSICKILKLNYFNFNFLVGDITCVRLNPDTTSQLKKYVREQR